MGHNKAPHPRPLSHTHSRPPGRGETREVGPHTQGVALGSGIAARWACGPGGSAFFWSHRGAGETKELYRAILGKAVRCPDPYFAAQRRWIVRRLAPDCSRIELTDLPRDHDTPGFDRIG